MNTLLLIGLAQAVPDNPQIIAEELSLAIEPPCYYCHQGGITQLGTVTTPFGVSLLSRGLVAYDSDSLRTALVALEAEGKDSDNDGVGDIQELRDGTDPNEGEGDTGGVLTPEYGCLSTTRAAPALAGLVVAFGLAAVRRS